jgi:hypothetical protein
MLPNQAVGPYVTPHGRVVRFFPGFQKFGAVPNKIIGRILG